MLKNTRFPNFDNVFEVVTVPLVTTHSVVEIHLLIKIFLGIVDEENCWSNAEGTRPSEKTRHCNEDACPANWWVGPWQLCPVTCKRHGM